MNSAGESLELPEALVGKLTHRLQEIRDRALLAIASKLESGQPCGLARSRQLLFNLFDYFLLDQSSLEKEALGLIERVLQSEAGRTLTAHIGRQAIRQQLETIRSFVDPQLQPKLDEVLADLRALQVEVPPLSFGSDGEASSSSLSPVGSVQQDSETPKQQRFPWQKLIAADESALRRLEGALRGPQTELAEACESLSDQLIGDFPPEVFLQRPGVVCGLLSLVSAEDFRPQASVVLRNLRKLARSLRRRLSHPPEPQNSECPFELPLEEFCARGAAAALACLQQAGQNPHISQASLGLISELLQLLQDTGQYLPRDSLEKLGETLEYFRLQAASLEQEPQWRRIYLHLLCISARFLPEHLPHNLQLALSCSLLDIGLTQMFAAVHRKLQQLLQGSNGALKRFQRVEVIKDALSATVLFLRDPPSDAAQCLQLAQRALSSVELHQSPQFLQAFVDLCARERLQGATSVVLALLANRSPAVRQHMYALCLEQVKESVGARAPHVPAQVEFLLDAPILEEIALFGDQEILLYLLKRPVLAHPQGLPALVPVLPVLLCHAHNATPLGRTLLELTNPDTAHAVGVPNDALIRANILLLFSKEGRLRREAASRLLWLLTLQDEAQLLPKLSGIRSDTLSAVCVLQPLLDVNKLRHSQHFYPASSLQRVVEVLQAPQTEPTIRRSALSQLSVLLEDHLMHEVFLSEGGVALLIALMQAALNEGDSSVCPDSVVAVVGALRSLAFYHPSVRAQLGADSRALSLLLRGLLVFGGDDRMRQDAGILLFVLALNGFVEGSPALGDLQIPALVQETLLVPFASRAGWRASRHRGPDLLGDILADKWSMSALQAHWHSQQPPIASALLALSDGDLAQLQASSIARQVEWRLRQYKVAEGNRGKQAILEQLNCYLQLHVAASRLGEVDGVLGHPWQEVLEPDLTPPAVYGVDKELLQTLVQLLITLQGLYKGALHSWVAETLALNCELYWAQLGGDGTPSRPTRDLLQLVASCAADSSPWNNVLDFIDQQLLRSNSLDSLLPCLVRLTAHPRPLPTLKHLTQTLFELAQPGEDGSFLGLHITRHLLVVLNQTAGEFQLGSNKSRARWFWELGASKVRLLLASRDFVVRAGALQLFASLAQSPWAMEKLFEEHLPHEALQLVADVREAGVVRESAARLLVNLSSARGGGAPVTLRALGVVDQVTPMLLTLFGPEGSPQPGLARAVCVLLANLADAHLSQRLFQLGLINPMIRSLSDDCATPEKNAAVCSLLRKLQPFLSQPTITKDSFLVLWSLFDAQKSPPEQVPLRNLLQLLASLRHDRALMLQALQESGLQPFLDTICLSLTGSGVGEGMQDAALLALAPLLPSLAEQLNGVMGERLCKILLNVHACRPENRLVVAALTGLVGGSQTAKGYALSHGLLEMAVKSLRDLDLSFSLTGEPQIEHLSDALGLLTNLLEDFPPAKGRAAALGLADVTVKLMKNLEPPGVLASGLRLLAVLTQDCPEGGASAAGQRVTVSASGSIIRSSLAPALGFAVDVIVHQLKQPPRSGAPATLQLAFDVLRHSFSQSACRKILSTKIMLGRIYTAIIQRPPSNPLDLMWVEFLEAITRFPEGQDSVAQNPALLALVLERATNRYSPNRLVALCLLRNLTFYPSNRPRLLALDAFFGLLSFYLTGGEPPEKRLVLLMIWALAANNHRAKVAFKLNRLDECLKRALQEASLPEDLRLMEQALALLR